MTVLPLPQYFKQSGAEEIADMSLKNTSIRDHVQVDYRNGRSSCLRTEKSKYYHLILWLNTTLKYNSDLHLLEVQALSKSKGN